MPGFDGGVTVVFDDLGIPSVSVEAVSRVYAPPRRGRLHRVFSVFGGVGVDPGLVDDDEDDDDDDSVLDEDESVSAGETRVALEDVTLRVAGGGCVALVGPSGSGKSVLLREIAGVAPPSSGRIVVTGRVAPLIRSLLQVVPRYGSVRKALPLAAHFVRLPIADARARLPEILELAGEPGLADAQIGAVSPKRRLNLLFALMLSLDPDILVVDGPLPPGQAGTRFRDRILELKQAGALVLVADRTVDGVRWVADEVVYLDGGRLLGSKRIEDAVAAS